MPKPETLTLRSSAVGNGLVLRCERTSDRFQSTVIWIDDQGTETVLLRSVEGTPNDDFPPSPPLQQMHLQEINGAPVMLAVGMAGRGHWSASIMLNERTRTEDTNCLATLVFQHAANVRGDTGWLGCTWMLEGLKKNNQSITGSSESAESEFSFTANNGIRFQFQAHLPVGCKLKLVSEPGTTPNVVIMPIETSVSGRPTCWDLAIQVFEDPPLD